MNPEGGEIICAVIAYKSVRQCHIILTIRIPVSLLNRNDVVVFLLIISSSRFAILHLTQK